MRDTITSQNFLLCYGQSDSHAPFLSRDGSPNPNPRAGQPYDGANWAHVVAMAAAPVVVPKAEAPAIIASDYREADGRSHKVQRERGRFGLLVLDIDDGGPSFEALEAALEAVVGDAERLIYSTSSATPELPKWRALVPLAEPMAGADWQEAQRALFELIEAELRVAMAAEGAEVPADDVEMCDSALDRFGQIFYLPAVAPKRRGPDGQPLFYRWKHSPGVSLNLGDGPIAGRMAQRAAERAEEERLAAERRAEAAKKRAARVASGGLSPIDEFNDRHDVEALLEKYGFLNEPSGVSRRGTDNWQSPYQRTGYATRCFGDHWVTLSRADADAGLGTPTKSGSGRWGDAFTLFAHFEHGGDVARAVAAYAEELRAERVERDSGGRFVGAGAMATDTPAEAPEWLGVGEAAERIREAVGGALDALGGDEEPVLAIAASPGAGKSRVAREVIAERLGQLGGDVAFYAPTLALAEEAAEHFEALGVRALVVRGREAMQPDGSGPMCQRAGLVKVLKAAGLGIGENMCRRKSAGGAVEQCPHYGSCPWVGQWRDLEEGPVVRCYSHAHLWLPDSSGRGDPVLRAIDEACWSGALGQADVPLAGWLRPRRCKPELAADIHKAALDVLTMLRDGDGLQGLGYSAEELRAFAAGEGGAGVIHTGPSASDEEIAAAARQREGLDKGAGARAAVWRALAEAVEAGRERCERVLMTEDGLRVHWRKAMPEGPVILLDADADPEILRALWPEREVAMVRAELKPQAEVVQVADKAFSKRALIGTKDQPGGAELRAELVGLVRLEVLRQRALSGGGVLVVGSKAVVVQVFKDAGRDAPKLGEDLHGAQWAWYGPATRGLNDWRGFGTVLLVGREELPPEALAGEARALFGDGPEPLELPEPDGNGNTLPPPETALPVLMADGSARAVVGRAYAEPRLRALQVQHRENGLRQAAERLRLAHAEAPKRVLVLSRVPVPGLPVQELVAWKELAPSRFARAMAEAALRTGILRTSAAGLAQDAPETFPSFNAAKVWLRTKEGKAVKGGGTPNKSLLGAPPPLIALPATLRLPSQRGQKVPALVLSHRPLGPEEAQQQAEAALGALAAFELVETPSKPQLVAHNETAKRPKRMQESWAIPAGMTQKEAFSELRGRHEAWKQRPAVKRAAGIARWMDTRAVAAPP